MTATFDQCSCESILEVEATLRVPLDSGLGERVQALLLDGARRIVLDLRRVSHIDAGGVGEGELVRAFNDTRVAGGVLRIAHANGHVRRLLDVAGVWRFMIGDTAHSPARATDVSREDIWRVAPGVHDSAITGS